MNTIIAMSLLRGDLSGKGPFPAFSVAKSGEKAIADVFSSPSITDQGPTKIGTSVLFNLERIGETELDGAAKYRL